MVFDSESIVQLSSPLPSGLVTPSMSIKSVTKRGGAETVDKAFADQLHASEHALALHTKKKSDLGIEDDNLDHETAQQLKECRRIWNVINEVSSKNPHTS